MNSGSQPAFSSPELQTAFDNARETLEGADAARNQVSQDIKSLEEYLASLGLATPFRHALGKYLIPENEQTVASSLEYGGCASGKIAEDAILLDRDSKGRTRLLYEVSEWEGHVEVDVPGGPFFWDDETLKREIKPLIETKFETRKRAYGELPKVLTALAGHLAINPWKHAEFGREDIPF